MNKKSALMTAPILLFLAVEYLGLVLLLSDTRLLSGL